MQSMSIYQPKASKAIAVILLVCLYISVPRSDGGEPLTFATLSKVAGTGLLLLGYWQGSLTLYKDELRGLLILIIPLSVYVLAQAGIMSDTEIFKHLIGYECLVLTVVYVYKKLGLSAFFKFLRYLMLGNLIFILIWTVCGTAVITDFRGRDEFLMQAIGPIGLPIFAGSMEWIRFGGLLGHPNFFGLVAALGIIGLDFSKGSKKGYFFWGALFIIALFLTQSRAAFLLVAVYTITKILSKRRISLKHILVIVFALILVMVITANILYLRGDDPTSGRMEIMNTLWSLYTQGLEINQWLGVGFGNLSNYMEVQLRYVYPADNSYIPLLLELGVVGTFMWLGVIAFLTLHVFSTQKNHRRKIAAYMAAVFAYSFLEHEFSGDAYSIHWIIFLLSFMAGTTFSQGSFLK